MLNVASEFHVKFFFETYVALRRQYFALIICFRMSSKQVVATKKLQFLNSYVTETHKQLCRIVKFLPGCARVDKERRNGKTSFACCKVCQVESVFCLIYLIFAQTLHHGLLGSLRSRTHKPDIRSRVKVHRPASCQALPPINLC
jgi:hypothetical protein